MFFLSASMDALCEKQKWSQREEEKMLTTPWLAKQHQRERKKGFLLSPTSNLKLIEFGSLLEKNKRRERKFLANANMSCEGW